MRILIVDDSRTARLLLKKALPPELLVDLTELPGGREAVAACLAQSFDLMFLDLTMPDVDGYEVLRRLGAERRLPRTIVVSADSQPGARERVLALGAAVVLAKPATRAQIEAALASMRDRPVAPGPQGSPPGAR